MSCGHVALTYAAGTPPTIISINDQYRSIRRATRILLVFSTKGTSSGSPPGHSRSLSNEGTVRRHGNEPIVSGNSLLVSRSGAANKQYADMTGAAYRQDRIPRAVRTAPRKESNSLAATGKWVARDSAEKCLFPHGGLYWPQGYTIHRTRRGVHAFHSAAYRRLSDWWYRAQASSNQTECTT